MNKYVWYASYGSNSLVDRFYCYIRGGQFQGNSTQYEGCKDKSLPLDEGSIIIPYALYFAKNSQSWNGGVGFIEIDRNENEKTFGRMYLITKEQFADVVRQETKRTESISIDFDKAKSDGRLEILENSWYGNLLYLGAENGYPIFTFTHSSNLIRFNRPSEDYLKTVIKGIVANSNLNTAELVEYLLGRPGVANNYTAEQLNIILDELNRTEGKASF